MRCVATGVRNGVPTPGFSASVNYYDSYRSENLPANLIQAQRDYFGAHTYERKDKEGIFHTQWVESNRILVTEVNQFNGFTSFKIMQTIALND